MEFLMKRIVSLVLCLFLITTFVQAQFKVSNTIDLTELDFYGRKGFQEAWTYAEPIPDDPAWIKIPANKGNRPIIVRNIFGSKDNNTLFQIIPNKPESFTFITKFTADSTLAATGGIGLYIAQIGECWEIYMNGNLVKSEIYKDGEGYIKRERSVRGAIVSIDARYMKIGENLLTIRIVGDPYHDRTGMYMAAPYVIGDFETLLRKNIEYLDLMLIGIYFFFALYHILLFVLRPQNKSYLWYGLGALLLSIYLLCRTFIIYDIILDSRAVKTIELFSLYLLFPTFLAFFDCTLNKKVSLFTYIYLAFCGLISLVMPFILQELTLRIWQYVLIVPISWLLIYDLIMPLARYLRVEIARRNDRRVIIYIDEFVRSLFNADAGKLLIGSSVIIVTVALDIYFVNLGIPISLSKYGFLILVFGAAGILASQFVTVYHEVEDLNIGLEKKVEVRTKELQKAMDNQAILNGELSNANGKLQNAMDISAKDMKMAVSVQSGMFPKRAPQTDAWDIDFYFSPASGVSGDFYDFYVDNDELEGVALGDVSGHGIASGLITVLARSVFYRHFQLNRDKSLGYIIESANGELIKELAQVEHYLTAILLRFKDDVVEYVNAAHTEILYKAAGRGRASILKPKDADDYKGPPLGREGLEVPYKAIKFRMNKGDSIMLYTDCLNETRNVEGEEFSVEGIGEALALAADGSAHDILRAVLHEFRVHVGAAPITDDLSMIVIKRKK